MKKKIKLEKLPIYRPNLKEELLKQNMIGLFANSLVLNPATEAELVYYSAIDDEYQIEEIKFQEIDAERRIVCGPALLPDQLIKRHKKDIGYFYLKYTKEDIFTLGSFFIKNGYANSTTLFHSVAQSENDVSLCEIWYVGKNGDKSKADFKMDYPEGTLMFSYIVHSDNIWNNYVKTGAIKGFSIEALLPLIAEGDLIEESELIEQQKYVCQAHKISAFDLNRIKIRSIVHNKAWEIEQEGKRLTFGRYNTDCTCSTCRQLVKFSWQPELVFPDHIRIETKDVIKKKKKE